MYRRNRDDTSITENDDKFEDLDEASTISDKHTVVYDTERKLIDNIEQESEKIGTAQDEMEAEDKLAQFDSENCSKNNRASLKTNTRT